MEIEHEFRFELFITVLFITASILSIIYVGFTGIKEIIFTTITIINIPLSYLGGRVARKLLYSVIRGYGEYED